MNGYIKELILKGVYGAPFTLEVRGEMERILGEDTTLTTVLDEHRSKSRLTNSDRTQITNAVMGIVGEYLDNIRTSRNDGIETWSKIYGALGSFRPLPCYERVDLNQPNMV